MMTIIIPFIFKSKDKIIKTDEICTKQNIKYHAILWVINLVLYIALILTAIGGTVVTSPHNSLLVTREAIEIIILIIITMIFFKIKYYIHHIISLIIFCSFSFGIDFLLGNYNIELLKQTPLQIIFNIVSLILEIVLFCYETYMMNTLYYHYWTIGFSLGLFIIPLNILSIIGAYSFGDENDSTNFYYYYFQFIKNAEFKYVFPRCLAWMIIYGLMQLFQLLALENLTPNHMMISYEIGKLFNNLVMSQSKMKWYSIILFVLQFIILLFFLEILEFNFCKLNENTKKNIEERGLTTMNMRDSVNSANGNVIDIDGYSIHQENIGDSNEMEIINGVNEWSGIN